MIAPGYPHMLHPAGRTMRLELATIQKTLTRLENRPEKGRNSYSVRRLTGRVHLTPEGQVFL